MNHIRDLLHRTPMDTRDAKRLLAAELDVNWFTVHKLYLDQKKEMSASQVLRAVNFFSQFFPCSFEDVFTLVNPASARNLGVVHPEEIEKLRNNPRRRKPLATA